MNSSTQPMTQHKAVTRKRKHSYPAVPSFVENCERLLRHYEQEESERQAAIAMKTSKLEEEALRQILAAGLPEPEREYQFVQDRKWRFDFAWLRQKVALEVQGGIWIAGKHATGTGIEKDQDKGNRAQIEGWTVLQVSAGHVKRGEVADMLRKVL